mgnify:CR=1 FL=1
MLSRARFVLVPCLASVLATSLSCKPEEDPETHGFVCAEWQERLCSESISGRAECEVTDMSQDIDSAETLIITYAVPDPNAIQGRKFLVGPLPLEEFAGCKPDVKIVGPSAVAGVDANGAQIWSIEAFNEAVEARSSLTGGGCLKVDVKRN